MSLKIAIIGDPLSSSQCARDFVCDERGDFINATRLMCQMLHVNCTFSWYPSSDYGDADLAGVGTGLIGSIERGEFDMSLPVYAPTYRRFKAVSFTDMYDHKDISLMTRAPPVVSGELDWNVINVFQWSVLILIILTLSICTILVLVTNSILGQYPNWASVSCTAGLKVYFDTATLMLPRQVRIDKTRFLSTRLVIATWLYLGIFVSAYYTAVLCSQSTLLKYNYPFTDMDSFVECLERAECRVIAETTSSSYIQAVTSNATPYGPRIAATFNRSPVKTAPIMKIPGEILKENDIYLVNIAPKDGHLASTGGNRDCLFYIMDVGLAEYIAFPLRKGSPYMEKLNMGVLSMWETGMTRGISRKYITRSYCDQRERGIRSNDRYLRYFLLVVMTFYCVGGIISSTFFLIEIVIGRQGTLRNRGLDMSFGGYRQG